MVRGPWVAEDLVGIDRCLDDVEARLAMRAKN